jgi:hypothetical protein
MRSPPRCRSRASTGRPSSSAMARSRRSATSPAGAQPRTPFAPWPPTSPISGLGRLPQAAGPLPWPAPERLALRFVAQHLYDPSRRADDPSHGMRGAVEAARRGWALVRRRSGRPVDRALAPGAVGDLPSLVQSRRSVFRRRTCTARSASRSCAARPRAAQEREAAHSRRARAADRHLR